jgi:peptidoglycan biosynthesis protein MviN/MurJ (putative lipid II flippase)
MPTLLRLWVGATYAQHALSYAEVLVGAQLIRLTMMPYALIGFSAGEQSRMLLSPLAEGVVNLVCSVVLAHIMGATGVALGTMVGAIVGVALHFWNSMPRTRSFVFGRREMLWEGILRPLGLAVIAAGLLTGLLSVVTSTAGKLGLLCAAPVIVALMLWKWQLMPEDRDVIQKLCERFLPFWVMRRASEQ